MNIVSYCERQGDERLRCAQAGCEDCLSALLRENRNLILAVIHVQYMGQVDDADLEQEGWIGFWQAVKWYDPQRGARFSTFAWLVIRHRIWRTVRRASSVERWQESEGPYSEAVSLTEKPQPTENRAKKVANRPLLIPRMVFENGEL